MSERRIEFATQTQHGETRFVVEAEGDNITVSTDHDEWGGQTLGLDRFEWLALIARVNNI